MPLRPVRVGSIASELVPYLAGCSGQQQSLGGEHRAGVANGVSDVEDDAEINVGPLLVIKDRLHCVPVGCVPTSV